MRRVIAAVALIVAFVEPAEAAVVRGEDRKGAARLDRHQLTFALPRALPPGLMTASCGDDVSNPREYEPTWARRSRRLVRVTRRSRTLKVRLPSDVSSTANRCVLARRDGAPLAAPLMQRAAGQPRPACRPAHGERTVAGSSRVRVVRFISGAHVDSRREFYRACSKTGGAKVFLAQSQLGPGLGVYSPRLFTVNDRWIAWVSPTPDRILTYEHVVRLRLTRSSFDPWVDALPEPADRAVALALAADGAATVTVRRSGADVPVALPAR